MKGVDNHNWACRQLREVKPIRKRLVRTRNPACSGHGVGEEAYACGRITISRHCWLYGKVLFDLSNSFDVFPDNLP